MNLILYINKKLIPQII